MASIFKKIFSRSWLSCERYAERASCRLDSPLSLQDELGFRFHHLICHTCRYVSKHWKEMNKNLGGYLNDLQDSEELTLSKERAEKIRQELARSDK